MWALLHINLRLQEWCPGVKLELWLPRILEVRQYECRAGAPKYHCPAPVLRAISQCILPWLPWMLSLLSGKVHWWRVPDPRWKDEWLFHAYSKTKSIKETRHQHRSINCPADHFGWSMPGVMNCLHVDLKLPDAVPKNLKVDWQHIHLQEMLGTCFIETSVHMFPIPAIILKDCNILTCHCDSLGFSLQWESFMGPALRFNLDIVPLGIR